MHYIQGTQSGATCSCGREWSVWRCKKRYDWGAMFAMQTIHLLQATAARHARAANRKEGVL